MAVDSKGNPANPLDKYRSYSYQHILLVSDTTEALRQIQQAQANGTFDTTSLNNAIINKPLPGTATNGSSGAYLVIDGRKTSAVSIKSLTYNSAPTNGNTVAGSMIILQQLTLEIYDMYGVTFLNYLQYLKDEALKCNWTGWTWVLQTMFIGHTDQGTTETILTNNLQLQSTNIDVEFDAAGGHYKMEMIVGTGTDDGVSAKAKSVGQSSTHLKSDANRTLWSVIVDLQNKLNAESKDYYDKLRVTLLPSIASNGQPAPKDQPQTGRLVQYMFTIPDEWKSFTVDGGGAAHIETDWKKVVAGSSGQNAQLNTPTAKKKNTNKGSVNITLDADISIDAALTNIIKHCDQILDLAGNKQRINGNEAKAWKINTNVTSDAKSVCLHWDIFVLDIPNVNTTKSSASAEPIPEEAKNWDTTKDPITGKTVYIPKNCLVFDYIFSGKNTDILHIDLKLPGINQIFMNTNPQLDPTVKVVQNQKNEAPAPATKTKNDLAFVQEKTPIFIPPKTADQASAYSQIAPGSSQSVQVRQEFYKTLMTLAGVISTTMKMTIRGNPILMAHTSFDIAPHISGPITAASSNDASYKQYRAKITGDANTANNTSLPKSICTYPLLTQVNIYTPDLDFDGVPMVTDTGKTNYSRKFWYDKYYQVKTITHNFSADGTFSQDLDLFTVETYSAPAKKDATPTAGTKK